MNTCYNCKFYKDDLCTNPETVQKSGAWFADGNSIACYDIKELRVGMNFGCVNWKEQEETEVDELVDEIIDEE